MIENTISIDGIEAPDTAANTVADETEMQNNQNLAQDAMQDADAAEAAEDDDAVQPGDKAHRHPEAADQPQMVELNLYGEKVQVPLAQAVSQAQKGIAFEHIKAQLAAAKKDARLTTLETVAKQSGKTLSQLVLEMHSNALGDSLAARYGSVADAPFEEVARAVSEIENCRRQLQQNETELQKQHWRSQLVEFVAQNPRCREIPGDVLAAAKQGENISAAYSRLHGSKLKQQLDEAQREIEVLRSSSKAAASATPSAIGSGRAKPKENEFLKIMQSTW